CAPALRMTRDAWGRESDAGDHRSDRQEMLRNFAAMSRQRKPPQGRRDGRWGSCAVVPVRGTTPQDDTRSLTSEIATRLCPATHNGPAQNRPVGGFVDDLPTATPRSAPATSAPSRSP